MTLVQDEARREGGGGSREALRGGEPHAGQAAGGVRGHRGGLRPPNPGRPVQANTSEGYRRDPWCREDGQRSPHLLG